jgi:hypothetical protein
MDLIIRFVILVIHRHRSGPHLPLLTLRDDETADTLAEPLMKTGTSRDCNNLFSTLCQTSGYWKLLSRHDTEGQPLFDRHLKLYLNSRGAERIMSVPTPVSIQRTLQR